MIIVQLTGGLGNQFFQYAAGKTLAEKYGVDLALDISLYKKAKRPFELDKFNISAKIATPIEIFKLKFPLFGNVYIDNKFEYSSDFFKLNKNSYLIGLFQSEKYFSNISRIVQNEFILKKPVTEYFPDLANKIIQSNSISVSIRRGDYLAKPHIYNTLTPEYYKKSMEFISGKINNPQFFFFSDDIDWTKNNISYPENSIFVTNGILTGPDEFELMTLCKHNIIANSTFSWWGAYLNKNKDKIIIAPEKWSNNNKINTKDVIPEKWIKL